MAQRSRWTNSSVLLLADEGDPVDAIRRRAQALVVRALDSGWSGPPFDPFALAEMLGLRVIGRSDIRDARTVPISGDDVQIEYNPNRPAARVRYSLAHEIAHTLFPDCAEQVRHRAGKSEMQGDEWQLEALCNIAAAEFLMPLGSLPHLRGAALGIEPLMQLREKYAVSAEALLIRAARLADEPCAAFCASRIDEGQHAGRYRVDYTIGSERWGGNLPRGEILPNDTHVGQCTAIGFTAKGEESWTNLPDAYVECVGIPPYPGALAPRVVGVLRARSAAREGAGIRYVRGDAMQPRGRGQKIIAHIVNDAAPRWGGRGFASALARRWPAVQDDFVRWVDADRARLRLGAVHTAAADDHTTVVHMIAQHGYGPSPTPRIRYAPLRACLEQVVSLADRAGATVHMPRIGTGQAGGEWTLVEELINEATRSAGVQVTVYDVPGSGPTQSPQTALDIY